MSRKNGGNGPRAVALVGPYGSGKTTLLESILAVTDAIPRKGAIVQKNTVGDTSPEARARQMSVEVNCATTKYLDENFTFLDCPGSIEFLQETLNVLPGVDAAIVVKGRRRDRKCSRRAGREFHVVSCYEIRSLDTLSDRPVGQCRPGPFRVAGKA